MLPRPTPFSVCLFQTSLKVRAELFELPKTDSVANFAHDVKVKIDIVGGVQDDREKFSRGVEMPEISARIPATHSATASFINWTFVANVFCVLDQQSALRCVQTTVAGAARGENAVHHVDAKRDVIRNLLGPADAHEIARALGGKTRGGYRRHFASSGVRLADRE